ncbi:MAG: helix-turn-helix domain-containing protein, partial [Firmicutes bacterium]|nr:helix-turn-helix domain-containing protein [Bacillota bacterium]
AVLDRYELALARSAAVIQEQDPVQRQEYSAWFDPFKDLTPAKRRQFLETLEVFVLDAGRSTQRTAELLGVHTNTVQYRLHRVEEKMGINLLQGPGAPGLVLALALRRLRKAGAKGRA